MKLLHVLGRGEIKDGRILNRRNGMALFGVRTLAADAKKTSRWSPVLPMLISTVVDNAFFESSEEKQEPT